MNRIDTLLYACGLVRRDRYAALAAELAAARAEPAAARERAAPAAVEPVAPAPAPAAAGPVPTPAGPGSPPAMARELIALTDRLDSLPADPSRYTPETFAALLRFLRNRHVALLAACEVTALRDGGPIDPLRHEVVDTRPAPSAEQADHIAETVRPGYRWRDELLRVQQVIAYVPAGESGARG